MGSDACPLLAYVPESGTAEENEIPSNCSKARCQGFRSWVSLDCAEPVRYLERSFRTIRATATEGTAPARNHGTTNMNSQTLYSDESAPSQTGDQ
jgi:hypothetical protein